MVAKNEPYGKDQQDVIDRFINGEIEEVERYWPLHGYFEQDRVRKLVAEDAKTDD